MTAHDLINALVLPPGALVDRRVPKTLLVENGAPTAADKRAVQDGIEELRWLAALKPTTVGVPAYRDEEAEYLEVAVLRMTLRPSARAARLAELVHRAIPYPVYLVVEHGGGALLSLAHKRRSRAETDAVVVDGAMRTVRLGLDVLPCGEACRAAFLGSLAITGLPASDLRALYQAWLDRMTALEVALITGVFILPDTLERAAALREGLDAHARLLRDVASLRSQARREKQVSKLVDINLSIRRMEAELGAIRETMTGGTP